MVCTKQVHTPQLTTPNNKITASDAQINRLVCELYGFTNDALPSSGCCAKKSLRWRLEMARKHYFDKADPN
jgi:hypothetical protein